MYILLQSRGNVRITVWILSVFLLYLVVVRASNSAGYRMSAHQPQNVAAPRYLKHRESCDDYYVRRLALCCFIDMSRLEYSYTDTKIQHNKRSTLYVHPMRTSANDHSLPVSSRGHCVRSK